MDKLTHSIQEIQTYKEDLDKTHQKVADAEPEDINFNDISFDVRNSGRLTSHIGKNTSQVASEQILKTISSGKDSKDKKKDVLKFLESITASLAKNLDNYQSLAKRLDSIYDDQTDNKVVQYEDDMNAFQDDLRKIYREVKDTDSQEVQLGDLASRLLEVGTNHNDATKQMGQALVSDINNLLQNHQKSYTKSYVLDYLLIMIGRVGFDAKDKGELDQEISVDRPTTAK